MNNKEIQELIKIIDESNLAELKIKQGDFAITIRSKEYFKGKGQQVVSMLPQAAAAAPVAQAPAAPQTTQKTTESKPAEETNADSGKYVEFKSPMVGTFYRKPSPDKDVFIKVGDKVAQGDVVCIIEAMKLFNEIECEIAGTVIKVLVDDQSPVEYDQALFLIDPA